MKNMCIYYTFIYIYTYIYKIAVDKYITMSDFREIQKATVIIFSVFIMAL